MKTIKFKRILYSFTALAISGAIIFPQLINANNQVRPPDDKVVDDKIYQQAEKKENPIGLIYKANSHADKAKFKTKDAIIKQTRAEKDSKVLSTTLMTYAQYSREELKEDNPGTIIENDRMVWVIKVDFPSGLKTRGGKFSKAIQTTVFDAETGDLIVVSSIGDEDTSK